MFVQRKARLLESAPLYHPLYHPLACSRVLGHLGALLTAVTLLSEDRALGYSCGCSRSLWGPSILVAK